MFYGLHGTLYIRLHDDIQFLQIAGLNLGIQIVQGHLKLRILQKLLTALFYISFRKGPCLLIRLRRYEDLACSRHIVQTENLNRLGGTCLLYAASVVVHHGPDLAVAGAYRDVIAHMKGSLLNQNRCNRSLALVKLRLNHKSSCPAVGVGFQLQYLGRQKDHFQKLIQSLMGVGRYGYEDGASAPVLRNQLMLY